MFTGIISHLGTVVSKSHDTLIIKTDTSLLQQLEEGMSISVDGICLTVTEYTDSIFSSNFMPETEEKTTIASMREDTVVNLELPATPQTLLAGHIVQGHIDGTGKILVIEEEGNSRLLRIGIDASLSKYIVTKGSITINGISLTVILVDEVSFTVGIIPHTWEHTNLKHAKQGQYVTIEVDVMAKYVEKMLDVYRVIQ